MAAVLVVAGHGLFVSSADIGIGEPATVTERDDTTDISPVGEQIVSARAFTETIKSPSTRVLL